jgi:hypothetical protein
VATEDALNFTNLDKIISGMIDMELTLKPNLDQRGRIIRTGLGISLLSLALFPPSALKTSKYAALLASLGTASLIEAALGYSRALPQLNSGSL